MAEETKPEAPAVEAVPAPAITPAAEAAEVVVPEAEKDAPPAEAAAPAAEAAEEKPAEAEEEVKKITQQLSFKEETNVVSELPEAQKKALEELKKLVQEALNKHELSAPPPPPPPPAKEEKKEETPKTEEAPKTEEEAPKTEEEPPKTEEPSKTEEEAPKTEEAPKVEEAPKTEEPPKTEEAPKAEEAPKTEETPKTEEEAPKTEDAPKTEEEKKEAEEKIIVEVAAPSEPPSDTPAPITEDAPLPVEPEEVSLWGIPLLADDRSDVILLKFLRARDFKVKEAFTMLRNTVRWRKEFGVDELLSEDLGNDYEKAVFTHGRDRQGRLVCYNVFGEFQNKELYQNTFADAEKRKKFLRWLIQFLEKMIRTLDFDPKGVNSFVLVSDLKNSPGYGKRDLYKVIDRFLQILQDNYPEFVAKQLCINVSWWYLAYNWIYLNVFTPRSKSKFVFASPSKTPETIFKYIAPEQVPIQFGGHSKDGEHEFSSADPVTEVNIKPGTKHSIDFAFAEASELVWELRVIGWDVTYGAEFTPEKEGSYSLNIAKPRKVAPTEEPVIYDSFKVTEPGKVIITIDNQSSKKKKLLYRTKTKTASQ